LRHIDDRDAVGGFVGVLIVIVIVVAFLENGIAVGIELGRRFRRRAADGDIDRLAIRADVNAARPFAHRDGGHRLARGAIDHRDVIRPFVGDVNVHPMRARAQTTLSLFMC
jgi:hypothetical protein